MKKNILVIDLVLLVGTLILAAFALVMSLDSGVQFSPLPHEDAIHAFESSVIVYTSEDLPGEFIRVTIGEAFTLPEGVYHLEGGAEVIRLEITMPEASFIVVELDGLYLLRSAELGNVNVDQYYLEEYQESFQTGGIQ